MGFFECPLCCAENFPDEDALQNHLLAVSENITCPICELQFETIRTLARHIGTECFIHDKSPKRDVIENDNTQNNPEDTTAAGSTENFQTDLGLTIIQEADPQREENEGVYVDQPTLNKLSEVFTICTDDSVVNNDQVIDETLNEDQIIEKSDGTSLGWIGVVDSNSEKIDEDLTDDGTVYSVIDPEMTPDRLYTCSGCNTTFNSIEEHLKEFHRDGQVLLDHVESEVESVNYQLLLSSQDVNFSDEAEKVINPTLVTSNISDNENTEDFLPSESVVWPQDEMNNIMLGSWSTEDTLQLKGDTSIQLKRLDPWTVGLGKSEGRWVCANDGYYYAMSETRIQELQNRFSFMNPILESAIKTITEDIPDSSPLELWNCDWPEDMRKLPIATFVNVESDLNTESDGTNNLPTSENKSYLYKNHRVRLVTVKGNSDGLPNIEDIPFTEKPPDNMLPVFEPAQDTSSDLLGSYVIMWPCDTCGYLDLHWSNLIKHKCLPFSNSDSQICMSCNKVFQTRRALINHYNLAHKGHRILIGKYTCPICSAKVQSTSHLNKHISMHKKTDLRKCSVCNSMVPKLTYDQHVVAHKKNGTLHLVCTLCNRPFKGEAELALHIPHCHLQEQTKVSLECTFCQSKCSDLAELREHLVSHNIPVKTHCCSYCPKSFGRLIDQIIHERVHTKSRPHECQECGRCFRLKNSLITHMRIHTGEKPFNCTDCIKSFRTKHLLRNHMSSHTNEMNYKCNICPKMFKCKDRAKVHENLHKKPFVCPQCGRAFHSLGFMKKHLENHDKGNLVFTCHICSQMFTRAAYFEVHLASDHGLDRADCISISTKKTIEHMNKEAKSKAENII